MNLHPAQTGIVLIQALVFVLILTFIGLAAVREAVLEQRVSRNLQASAEAFQAVENCLAERLNGNPLDYCGSETLANCNRMTEDQAANDICCILGNSSGSDLPPSGSSVDIQVTRRYYEISSNGCADDPDYRDAIDAQTPRHRVGFFLVLP